MSWVLETDLYELRMAASYLRREMHQPATFSLFVRRLPPERAFLVAAGLDECLGVLENFRFTHDDLEHLGRLGFDRASVEALAGLRFSGEVVAVPEGRILFPDEPLLEVTAPLAEAQVVETVLLNRLTFPTAVASKAARCRLAAGELVELVEFGLRRSQGPRAGLAAARGAAMVGFAGTSNVEAARRYNLVAVGTMAHSYVQAFRDEPEAFRAFAADYPEHLVFLVDTYDSLTGVARAIEVIRALDLKGAGIRLDSGDLVALARQARGLLDRAGLADTRIFASGDLDEYALAALVAAGAPVDAAGVGTRLAVSADRPYLETVYKLVDLGGRPVRKLSPGKASLPGAKQVWRSAGFDDLLGRRDEPAPPGSEALLEPVMSGGRRLRPPLPADQALRAANLRFETDLAALGEPQRRLDGRPLRARRSPALERLAAGTG